MLTLLPRKFSTSSRLRGPCVTEITLVLAKHQGESKAYFCIARHYKTKAAPYVNLFNMTIFSQQRAGARVGVQAILT